MVKFTLSVTTIRENLEESLELLEKRIPVKEFEDLVRKLDSILGIIINNENKIWLRTRKGRKLLTNVNAAANKLMASLSSSGEYDVIEKALNILEAQMKVMDEESRKRNMIIT